MTQLPPRHRRMLSGLASLQASIPMAGVFVALSLSLDLSGAPLPPDDPSLTSNLVTWLADPASNFEDGTWYDLGPNRYKLTTVGGLTDPAIITESPGSGLFSGKSFSSLFFSQSASELLSGPSGASSYAALTAVVVYRATQRDGNLRPFGIGSLNPLSPVPSSLPHVNMGTDPSIRKDNGSLIGHTIAHPLDRVFIRTTVFDSSGSGSIKELFDGSTAYSSNSTHYTVNSGQLFVGDVRNSATPGNLSVAEVIVFNRALSAGEISGVEEYLVANIGTSRPAPRSAPPSTQGSSDRPNILLIVSDDHGSIDLNCFGATDLGTPHLNGLAAEGLKLTQFTVTSSVCTPSRGAFLTGRYPPATGITGNSSSMPSSEFTMAELAKTRGYHTGIFGKWHLGDPPGEPLRHGFDTFYGFLKGTIENYEHDRLNWDASNGQPYESRVIVEHELWRDSTSITEDGTHFGDLIVRETNAFMEEHQDEPFFAYAAFNTPHYPVQPYENFYQSYSGLAEPRRSYAALVSTLDYQIGQILNKLDELELAENTIVIYFGDHGHSLESRTQMWNPGAPVPSGGGDNGPYRGNKFTLWEGGVRVPAIIRWPAVLPAGETRSQLIMSTDLMPTLSNLLGVNLPNRVDGRDIFSVLSSTSAASPHSVVHYYLTDQWAIREGPWKLVNQNNNTALYNLDTDIGETTDLDAVHPGIADRLQRLHNLWAADPEGNHEGISANELAVSDLSWATSAGSLFRDYSPTASSILLANGTFVPKGVSSTGDSSLTLNLGGLHTRFLATIAHSNTSPTSSSVTFEILGDGVVLYSSGARTRNSSPIDIDLDVTGVDELILRSVSSTNNPVAVWGSARVEFSTDSLIRVFQNSSGTSTIKATPPASASTELAALVSIELPSDLPNAEFYLMVSDNLDRWRESRVVFSGGVWSIEGQDATLETATDLGGNRWKIEFGLPPGTASFARMRLRMVATE
ncbi:sulfatase-like hydrolase/transferase [Haloferula sp.]|uniref:sulfatase-like hydrolase/transferase n=1 Tax=Haloferula sp. TaxID=2497595 RepID=UPI003C7677B3